MNKLICLLLVCFGVNANSLHLLCEGNLTFGKIDASGFNSKKTEDALIEIFIKDATKSLSLELNSGSYINMPKGDGFIGYWDNHNIRDFSRTPNEYKIKVKDGSSYATDIKIQRRTGRIFLVSMNHRYDGVCEAMKENKF